MFQHQNEDAFFSDLANTKPYIKMGFQGFAGTGKTYTAALIAAGLYQLIGSTKPLIIFDTERASKFLKPLFAERKIPVLVKESRSLADLQQTMKRCDDGAADILIIDSISHVWENFLEAYKGKAHRSRLEFQDWGIIKPTWKRDYSDMFVNGKFHCLMTGRAGYEYESEINEDTHKREIFKSGIKMKVEGETAYEPDFLILMERFEEVLTDTKKVWREATVLKDRSTILDGKTMKNPTFEDFKPSIETAMLDGVAFHAATTDDSGLFRTEEDKAAWRRRRDIALEKIEGELTKAYPGQTAEEKRQKKLVLEFAYGTTSWKEVEGLSPEVLEDGIKKIVDYIQTVEATRVA